MIEWNCRNALRLAQAPPIWCFQPLFSKLLLPSPIRKQPKGPLPRSCEIHELIWPSVSNDTVEALNFPKMNDNLNLCPRQLPVEGNNHLHSQCRARWNHYVSKNLHPFIMVFLALINQPRSNRDLVFKVPLAFHQGCQRLEGMSYSIGLASMAIWNRFWVRSLTKTNPPKLLRRPWFSQCPSADFRLASLPKRKSSHALPQLKRRWKR